MLTWLTPVSHHVRLDTENYDFLIGLKGQLESHTKKEVTINDAMTAVRRGFLAKALDVKTYAYKD